MSLISEPSKALSTTFNVAELASTPPGALEVLQAFKSPLVARLEWEHIQRRSPLFERWSERTPSVFDG